MNSGSVRGVELGVRILVYGGFWGLEVWGFFIVDRIDFRFGGSLVGVVILIFFKGIRWGGGGSV